MSNGETGFGSYPIPPSDSLTSNPDQLHSSGQQKVYPLCHVQRGKQVRTALPTAWTATDFIL